MDSCYDVLPLLLKRWEHWQDCAQEYTSWCVKYVSKFPLHEPILKNIRMERGRKDKLYYLYVVNEHQEKLADATSQVQPEPDSPSPLQ